MTVRDPEPVQGLTRGAAGEREQQQRERSGAAAADKGARARLHAFCFLSAQVSHDGSGTPGGPGSGPEEVLRLFDAPVLNTPPAAGARPPASRSRVSVAQNNASQVRG